MRKVNYNYMILWLIFIFLLALISFLSGTSFNNYLKKRVLNYNSQSQNKIYESNSQKKTLPKEIINKQTRVTYKYYYQEDGLTESMTELAPKFLVGLTKQELKNIFLDSDWQINKFSPQEIILKKYISGKSNQHYIIGIKDGYVAVFYQEKINGCNLKEITNTPVSSLSLEDQARLKTGIKISGEDNLFSIMQDYES